MRSVRRIEDTGFSLLPVGLFVLTFSWVVFETVAPAPLEAQSTKFAATSIRSIPAGTPITAEALGIACQGVDGVRQTVTAAKIGVDPVLAPPRGRCKANGVTLQSIIGFAYGIPERNVTGGPNWSRMSGRVGFDPGTFTLHEAEAFLVDAVADDPATAKVEELRRMLQTMLADRFGLKSHRETRQAQGYSLVLARDGLKIQEVSGPYEAPRAIYDETLRRSIKGTSRLDGLVEVLLPPAFGPIIDKTGLTGVYRYEFPAPVPPPPAPAAPGRGAAGGIAEVQPITSPISELSRTLEVQLGLRLQSDLVPIELLVIDGVERPSDELAFATSREDQ
jgi:uncharacterized protein (TIGR03435 family)